jgi:PAS domain S-box-containing protein
MKNKDENYKNLLIENNALRSRLEEAEETLHAIRNGEIDALVVNGQNGHQVYTLQGAEHTYRVLIESMNEGAVTLDLHGNILYCNNSFAEMVDLPLEKVIGSEMNEYITSDQKKLFNDLVKHALDQKNSISEMLLQTQSKSTKHILLSINHFKLGNGESGISIIITDLAEQKKNEELAASEKYAAQKLLHERELRNSAEHSAEELKIEKDNLQKEILQRKKLETQREDFIGIASHELKTPVTSIKAYTQVLQSRLMREGNVELADHLGKMDGQLDKLTGLIGDLLDSTKIEAGKLQFHEGYYDFNELVLEIVDEIQRTTQRHTIQTQLTKTKIMYGDRDRIGQTITNLLTNAIKYSPNADRIIITSVTTAKAITLRIQDFGIGISKEKRDKVFERFYRVEEREHQETYAGLGLGLYISAEIIRRHGGDIWVESEEKQGSTVCFTLPITKKKTDK